MLPTSIPGIAASQARASLRVPSKRKLKAASLPRLISRGNWTSGGTSPRRMPIVVFLREQLQDPLVVQPRASRGGEVLQHLEVRPQLREGAAKRAPRVARDPAHLPRERLQVVPRGRASRSMGLDGVGEAQGDADPGLPRVVAHAAAVLGLVLVLDAQKLDHAKDLHCQVPLVGKEFPPVKVVEGEVHDARVVRGQLALRAVQLRLVPKDLP
eukprot:scaffold7044_cov216-Pinguiococcus_pyrenoidosus.AAC.7